MARYDSLRKEARNKALRKYKEKHPTLSYAEIAKEFNIDVSRAWRIINGNQKAKPVNHADIMARAQRIAEENMNSIDTLVER